MEVLKLLRIKHWIKNLFLFIPVFFAGELFVYGHYLNLLLGFFSYSFIASAVYIINDYNDIEADRKHPKKKERPLASGTVSIRLGFVLFILLITFGFYFAFSINPWFLIIVSIYFFLNIAYSFGLKNISILDLFIVASGFLLRVVGGGVITNIFVSEWLIIMVFLLAIFLGLAKRRDDILMFNQSGKVVRKASQQYNLDFTNACLTMLSAIIFVAYLMYTISEEIIQKFQSHYVYGTSIFVLAGIMRYLQITLVENNSASPTKVLYTDKFIIITLIGWIVMFYMIIYLHKF